MLGIFTMNAAQGEKAFGAQFNYASKHSMVGLGLNFHYEFINNVRVEPEFIYYFKSDGIDAYNLNLNFNYLIRTSRSFAIYPLAGFSYARISPEIGDGVNRFGANVGLGANYTSFLELKKEPRRPLQEGSRGSLVVVLCVVCVGL